ncbi:hypothetical protein DVR12_22595 [Chitinophaga silvatica]|uniref:Uncharacterized protein n=1 Tax=Chitinophaga silvatica TaxID=2282649 RepID=A0A3E1Y4N0_9BACT|nr:hypothetical protein [Chitinophaga silvatica]RFS19427.1 hypothetical protein DVR12_22595 [Chitinophaga silvatica]
MSQEQFLFDFNKEVQKDSNFKALFPGDQSLRAMLWIYGKTITGAIPNDRFSEEVIFNAFQETNHEVYQRVPASNFNAQISDLQKFYLRYDEDEQIYTFRDHGKSIFKTVETTLSGNFNPTEIEIICTKLKADLTACQTTEELEVWTRLHFPAFEPNMNTQVDSLDRYIHTTVSSIRVTAQLQSGNAIETLKDIDSQLEKLRQYNTELKAAFSSMKEINQELNKRIHSINDSSLLDKVERVRQFFPHVKYRLGLIDKRLDRLQPRLRQFFSALNKPLFNTQVEKFLHLLLTHSQVEGAQKNVVFPLEIQAIRIFQPTPTFTYIQRKDDLFPPIPRKRIRTEHSPSIIQSIHKGLQEKIVLQRDIEKYVKIILNDCLIKQEVLLSNYFFLIIEETKNVQLAVRVAHSLIIRLPYKREEFNFIVDKSNTVTKNGITIWEMKISSCR